jgi:hypothetical protein
MVGNHLEHAILTKYLNSLSVTGFMYHQQCIHQESDSFVSFKLQNMPYSIQMNLNQFEITFKNVKK